MSVLTVLVVLAGLLSMHGLDGGHRVDATITWVAAAADAAPADVGHAAPAAGSATAGVVALAPGAVVPGQEEGHGSGLMTLCLAVLAGGLLLLLSRRRPASPVAARPRPALALHPRTARPPQARDLVAELCVSRT